MQETVITYQFSRCGQAYHFQSFMPIEVAEMVKAFLVAGEYRERFPR